MSDTITPALAGITESWIGADASKSASDAQVHAADTASATQLQMYNQSRADQTPWRAVGGQALNSLAQFYGLPGYSDTSQGTSSQNNGFDPLSGYSITPDGRIVQKLTDSAQPSQPSPPSQVDYNKILSNLPGYQFQLDQGSAAVDKNLAARGLLQSGAAGKELSQFGQGLASTYANQYVNGLQSLAGLGQTSTSNTGALGANAANQIGNSQLYAGNARASGYINMANSLNNGINNGMGLYGMGQNSMGSYGMNAGMSSGAPDFWQQGYMGMGDAYQAGFDPSMLSVAAGA